MLRFAMLSLVGCVSCGVLGFGGSASVSWSWAPALFYVFLGLSAAGFLGGTLPWPAELREARITDRLNSRQ